MNIDEVREIASAKGILSTRKYGRREDLIRVIQLAEGKEPCYLLNDNCQRGLCMWRDECCDARGAERGE